MMNKTLTLLFEKATIKGFAKINGRQSDGYNKGPIVERYSVKNDNNCYTLKHWGTVILEANLNNNKINYVYGQSFSDSNAINSSLSLLGLKGKATYRPKTDGGFAFNGKLVGTGMNFN